VGSSWRGLQLICNVSTVRDQLNCDDVISLPIFRGQPSPPRSRPKMAPERFSYPNVRRDESAITDYHGTKVSDPYVWLEDPDSKETVGFVEQQNAITMPYLADCGTRENFKTR